MTNWLVNRFVKGADDIHDPKVHTRYGRLAGVVGIVCNLALAAAKLAAGILSGSIAIMADSVNNLSDASASVVTLVGFWLAGKPADKEHPFGHARYEYIAGLAVAVLVLVIGIELGKSSIDRILNPAPVQYGVLSLVVLALSVLVKLWMASFNRTLGRRIGSATLQATFVDSRNDAIATTAVLCAALVARFSGLALDGYMGAAVAVFILVSGARLVRDTLDPLLGAAPDEDFVEHVLEKITAYPGVVGTHDLIIHDYGPGRRFASAHVEMASDEDALQSHDVIDKIERDFLKQDNLHLILHHDPVPIGRAAAGTLRGFVQHRVMEIDPRLSIHDFRTKERADSAVYIFDVVVPPGFDMPEDELRRRIEKAVQRGPKPVQVQLTVDNSYAAMPK